MEKIASFSARFGKERGRERERKPCGSERERLRARERDCQIIVHSRKFLHLIRFGHFARECREEEDRCYKCHGRIFHDHFLDKMCIYDRTIFTSRMAK